MARRFAKLAGFLLVASLGFPDSGSAQKSSPKSTPKWIGTRVAHCEQSLTPLPIQQALMPVCARAPAVDANIPLRNAIVVGFVGGFAQHDDLKHPEVKFASLLRESYPSTVHAEVFGNHDGDKALRSVLQLVDGDEDGVITASEREHVTVIIYGHSWGGSQTVALARALARRGIPVSLTIQLDSVRKPGQEDSTIPANVKQAINFYQTRGLIHGRTMIHAADPETTNILGNFEMTYRDHRINCDNYPWLARHFNKPHHEIENDPQVWDQVASLIYAAIVN
jgi:hypothetical protein